jgi:hypothetical protein
METMTLLLDNTITLGRGPMKPATKPDGRRGKMVKAATTTLSHAKLKTNYKKKEMKGKKKGRGWWGGGVSKVYLTVVTGRLLGWGGEGVEGIEVALGGCC